MAPNWISGWGSALPSRTLGSEELERLVGERSPFTPEVGRLESATGVRSRHYASDEVQPSDLAAAAALQAIGRSGRGPEDIGLVMHASVSGDVLEPAVANIVQEKIGASNAAVFDVGAGSNSFLYALHCTRAQQAGRLVLVTSGEVLSRRARTAFATTADLERGLLGLAGGDGGAALVLDTGAEDAETVPFGRFTTRGSEWRSAFVESGGARLPNDFTRDDLRADLDQYTRCVRALLPPLLRDVVDGSGWQSDELIVVSNLRHGLVGDVADLAGLDRTRTLSMVATIGDVGAATMPLTLCLAADDGRVERGQKIVLLGAAAGFGGAAVPIIW